jgi:hypothetical protein
MANFLLGLCGAWYILWFVIWALVALWVYRDAERRGTSGLLWAIVVILLGIVGLIIYLVVRPKQQGLPPSLAPPPPGYAPPPGQDAQPSGPPSQRPPPPGR